MTAELLLTGPMRAHTIVLNLVLGIGSFTALSAVLRTHMPGPADYDFSAKLEYFQEHVDEYDAVFVGSSAVYRHFVPRAVNSRLAELGVPIRTFNLGAPGTLDFEADYVLRQVLDTPGLRLQYVFAEPTAWTPILPDENLHTNRTVDWHTLRQTAHAVESAIRLDKPWTQRIDWVLTHLRLLCWNLSNYGQGPRLVAPLMETNAPPAPITREEMAKDLGYQALEDRKNPAFERRAALLRNVETYQKRVAVLSRPPKDIPDLSHVNLRAHRSQLEAIRAAGAEPIHVISPVPLHVPVAEALNRAGQFPVLLQFNHSGLYPEFYDLDHRFDMNHLNRSGARMFSRRFATEFASYLKNGSTH